MADLITPSIFSAFPTMIAGVSTRNGGVSPEPLGMNLSYKVHDDAENVRMNRQRFFGSFGSDESRVAFADQCHSSTVRVVSESGVHPSCDALITNVGGLGLAVSIADCVPILLFDPGSMTIAAIHAGWRGSASMIVLRAFDILTEEFGTDPSVIRAYIGPAAGPCCYEVGADVQHTFRESVRKRSGGRLTIDLKMENSLQLQQAGVRVEHIEIEERCTICTPDLFHSYRRDGNASGRMLAFIERQEED